MQPKKKYIVQEGQNLFDVAIELFGSVSGIGNLLKNTPGLNVSPLFPGQELYYLPQVINKEVVNDYASRGYFSTTADSMTDAPIPDPLPDPGSVVIHMHATPDVTIEAPGEYTVVPSTVEDGDGNLLETLAPGQIYIDAPCPLFEPVIITDSDDNTLYILGTGETQPLPDAVAKNSAGDVIGTNLATQEILVDDITITQADGSEDSAPAGAPVACEMPELHLVNSLDNEIETITSYPALGLINAPDAAITLKDTLGAPILTDSAPSGDNKDIEAPDSTYVLKDTAGSIINADVIVCGGNANIIAPNGTIVLKDTGGVTILTDSVKSNASKNIVAPDGAIVLKDSGGATILTDSVKSNGSKNVTAPDGTIVLKDTAGATLLTDVVKSNGSKNIVAPDATVNRDGVFYSVVKSGGVLNVPSASPSGIYYKRPFCSQKTSFRTGDAGWHLANGTFNFSAPTNPAVFQELDYTVTDWFYTLAYNNAFGNKYRFTNSAGSEALDGKLNFSGAKTYTTSGGLNYYVVDHLTGLGFYVSNLGNTASVVGTPANGSWNNAIDVAHAQRAGALLGFSNWFPITLSVAELCQSREAGAGGAGSIFKQGVVSGYNESFSWFGDTHMTSTSLARYYRQGNEFQIISKGSTSVQTVYVCRAHY